ncbi:alternative sulfate transporter [Xylariales sp. PMI_506]|nr:alternative sulfate transporter [Xylariales sp. PMI_506]
MAHDLKDASIDAVAAHSSQEKVEDSDVAGEDVVFWTAEEEKRLVRKIDLVVMPVLLFAFLGLQLDRGNIGNAATDNFMADVGITQDMYNVGTQLLATGIVLLEIPSNMILYRVGPNIWIGCQIIAWGLVATFQMFQKGLGGYLSTRLLLGLCEAGFIPASLYTLSLWYTAPELSKRFAIFYLGNLVASAIAGLLAFGILQMRGISGLAGWQWLFLIEGLITIVAGITYLVVFPGTPSKPVTLIGIKHFNEREATILRRRVEIDDASKRQHTTKITLKDIKDTLSNWTIYPHILIPLVAYSLAAVYGTYGPTLVASFGYNKIKANAMMSIGTWISVIFTVTGGFVADKTGKRGYAVLTMLFGLFLFQSHKLIYRCLPDHAPGSTKFGILTMGIATLVWWHPVNGSWLSINATSSPDRSVRLALFVMAANASGIIGGQLLRSDDAPYYHRGFTIITVFISITVVLAGIAVLQYVYLNKKVAKLTAEVEHQRATQPLGSEGVVDQDVEYGRYVRPGRYYSW